MNPSESSQTKVEAIRKEIRIESGPIDYEEQSESVSINPNTSNLDGDQHQIMSSNCTPSQKNESHELMKNQAQVQHREVQHHTARDCATQIYAWGCDSHGQMGISNKKQNRAYITPKIYSFNINLRQASCGDQHAAIVAGRLPALRIESGHVYTMGNNSDGRLGIVEKENRKVVNVPVLVQRLLDFKIVKISCGSAHTTAITDSGEVFSWGLNQFGTLGLGRIIEHSHPYPTRVPFFIENKIRVIDVSCGSKHTGYVAEHGALYMCGSNQYGQLGLSARALPPNSMKIEACPKHVTSLAERIIQIACGQTHTLALSDQNNIYAMGSNKHGQLGTGNKISSLLPTRVMEADEKPYLFKVAAGGHSAAIGMNGELFLWGSGTFGEFLCPTEVAKSEGIFVDVSVGSSFGSAVHENGSIWTWGTNSKGELGLGDMQQRIQPTRIKNLRGRKAGQVSSGGSFSISISTPSQLKIRRLMGDVSMGAIQSTRHLRDAITEFEQKIGTGGDTTPKALPSITEDAKEENIDESNRKKNQRTFYHQVKTMKSSRTSKENPVVTVKKAIAQAHRQVSKRIEQSRSASRSRSFNAPLQIQKNKLSTKDLGSGTTAVVATNTFAQRRGSAQHVARGSKARISVQVGAEMTHSSSRISHRRSTTTNENLPHTMSYQIQPSFQEFSKTRQGVSEMHSTHGNLKERSVSPAMTQRTLQSYASASNSRSTTPIHQRGTLDSRGLSEALQTISHKSISKVQETVSQASTKDPLQPLGAGNLSSRIATPDNHMEGATTDRDRIRIKEIGLRCEELRLENYKLVEGPGGVLELKRLLASKETHFEEIQRAIHQEKTELIKKLEEQTHMLESMEQELVMLRRNQDHYDKKFKNLDTEKIKITMHTEEEITRLEQIIQELQSEKKEVQRKYEDQLAERTMEAKANQQSTQDLQYMKENFETKINDLLLSLNEEREDKIMRDRQLEDQRSRNEAIEIQYARLKQLSERQSQEIERYKLRMGRYEAMEEKIEDQHSRLIQAENYTQNYKKLSHQQCIEIQQLKDSLRGVGDEEREKRIKAEDANDKLRQLTNRQIQEIDKLRKVLEMKNTETRELELERERRLKAEENNDRLKQLSNQQLTEIEKLKMQLEEISKTSHQTYHFEEQLDKQKQINVMQATEMERLKTALDSERKLRTQEAQKNMTVELEEAVQKTEVRISQRFETERRGFEDELRDLRRQIQTLEGIVKGARDESAKLRLEIKDWEKRGDIYESTVMGLKVQVNCLEQQRSTLSSQVSSPVRRSMQSQLVTNQSMCSVRPSEEVSEYRDFNLSSARARKSMRSEEGSEAQITPRQDESARRFKIRVTELEDSRSSNYGLSEEERKKKLEAYSMNLLKSIEKRASTQGQGGIDSRFKHLATNPVMSSLSSRIMYTRSSSVSMSGSCAPQLGGRSRFFVRDKHYTQDKTTPVRRNYRQIQNDRTQSTNISIVNTQLSEQKPKRQVKFGITRSLRGSQEGSLHDEGLLTQRSQRVVVIEKKSEPVEAAHFEHAQSQGGEEVSMSYRSETAGGVSSGVRAALASMWVQSKEQTEESMISSQTGQFEVMRSKLQKISLTSKELEKQASETAEDIEYQERVFKEEGPPSVGDAAPPDLID